MQVMVTTGTIRCTRLQSNRRHQQTNTQFFYRPDALRAAQPTVSKHRRERSASIHCMSLFVCMVFPHCKLPYPIIIIVISGLLDIAHGKSGTNASWLTRSPISINLCEQSNSATATWRLYYITSFYSASVQQTNRFRTSCGSTSKYGRRKSMLP